MIRKVFITILIIGFFSVPAASQSTYIELSYQSFKPFVNFQLNLGNSQSHYRNSYQAAYLKGYMDGVNDAYYNDYRFYELVRDIDIYEAGYRDGYRDRELLIRLRGHNWYHRHRFVYDDYHSPYYSVQIWLDGLTFSFLQAPRHRLPDRWTRRAHPKVRKYRTQMQKRKHYAHIEKRYEKRLTRLRKDARKTRSRYQQGTKNYRTGNIRRASKLNKNTARKRLSQPRQRGNRSRSVQQSSSDRTIGNSARKTRSNQRIERRSRVKKNSEATPKRNARVKRSSKLKQQKTVRSRNNKRNDRQPTVRKANNRQKNRGSVERSNSNKKSKSRRSSRSGGNRSRGN